MNTIKKNIFSTCTAAVVAVVMMIVCIVPAHAEDFYMPPMDTTTTQSTEIEYNIPSTFIVEIPSYMSIDTPVQLMGTNFNIAADKCVVASIEYDSFNDDNNIPMYLDDDDNVIEVAIYDSSKDEKVTRDNPVVARFDYDESGYAYTNYFHAELTGDNAAWAKAGQYHGTVTFTISTQSKN